MKPDNAAELLAAEAVDGALVGGASLDPGEFAARSPRAGSMSVRDGPDGAAGSVAGVDRARRLGAGAAGARATRSARPRRRCSTSSGTRYPHTTLSASGRDVGLPDGQMGNSEVGHLNLGAGSIVKQDLTRIDDAIADGSFFENPVLKAACEAARSGPRGRLHLMGLVSDGGVHSGWEHIEACIELAAREGVPDLVVHAFTDGRDTLPTAGAGYIRELERWLRHAGRIGTVSGRYYAMDRDRRWDRTKLAYDAIVHAEGLRGAERRGGRRRSYGRGETDEFIRPTVIGDYDGVADGDAVLHFNFRPDRARQLVRALGEPDFDEFPRGRRPGFALTTLTEYRKGWEYPVAFPPRAPEDDAGRGDRAPRRAPAPRRRDREVRPRHLLLQRRSRGRVGGGGALPRALGPRRPHL